MTPPQRPALVALDHVQLAMPEGEEGKARGFYSLLLGLREIEKPESLKARGGCWFTNGAVNVHIGVDPDFHAAKKAHPAFRVAAIEQFAAHLHSAGYPVTWDRSLPHVRRFFTADPFGNRLELIADA